MSKIFISEDAKEVLIQYISTKGEVIKIPKTEIVYREISAHPDIYMCKLGTGSESEIYMSPEMQCILGSKQKNNIGQGNKKSERSLCKYPYNIGYNGCVIGEYFIHNLKYTNEALIDEIRLRGLKEVNVKQGYSKCNILTVGDTGIITSDKGIACAVEENCQDMEVLTIDPGDVRLEGFDYGFIGGSSGQIGSEIVFHGDLEKHPFCEKIIRFIEKQGFGIKYFKEFPLEDIGSIIEGNVMF